MSARPLLLEIGCEELPSSSLRALGEGLRGALLAELASRDLAHGDSHWYASPRRLAVRVEELAEKAPDREREALGPPLAQARDENGNWTRAAEGFARRQGVPVEALQAIATPKGERLGLRSRESGAATETLLLELVNAAVEALPIPRRMRWGAGRTEFARPVHWVVLLYGERHGFGPVLGVQSGRESRGHRFHAPQPLAIGHPRDYERALGAARVIADFERRRSIVREQVEAQAAALGARALLDAALLDEVTSLVEWPVALAGRFDESFLEVPAPALISSMQGHQKYFPVVADDGALLPHFITVSNIDSHDPAQIVAGNERVIRPRLADAAFFFRQDLRASLESRLAQLDEVVFQDRLGSLGARAGRIERLAGLLAVALAADRAAAERAGRLCKADLVSEMVLEFADLQGIAGAHYARHDGEPDAVAAAIEEHYWPTGSGAALPENPVSLCVALADRLDTLVGIFGIGQPPSGSRDPFALRRAAIATLRLLIERELPLDLRDCLDMAVRGFAEGLLLGDTATQVLDYCLDRLPALYESEDLPIEVIRAVRATGVSAPLDLHRRVLAVQAFLQREEAAALAAANKRVANILAKVDAGHRFGEVSTDLLAQTQEQALHGALTGAGDAAAAALAAGDYRGALSALAALRGPVDAFFDAVMVNTEDPSLRHNRLNLLYALRQHFLAIADLSQLGG